MKKSVLILSFTNLENEPRVQRQIALLKDEYDVSVVGIKPPKVSGIEFYPIRKVSSTGRIRKWLLLKTGRYEHVYWNYEFRFKEPLPLLQDKRFDLIIAHHILAIPFALKIRKDAKILADAHEYYPLEREDSFLWNLLFRGYMMHLCRKYLKECSQLITVGQSIAEEYEKNYGIECEVINNSADYMDIQPTNIEPNVIKIINHGGAAPNRKLEKMIEATEYLDDRFRLHLMLTASNEDYLKKLKKLAEDYPKVTFIDPVPMKDIVKTINKYDIGLYILEPNSFNNRFALPNKIFEFIQARLCIAIGPSPEMKKLVEDHELGVVAKDFEPKSIAEELNKLSPEKIGYYKDQCNKNAHKLSAAKSMEKLDKIISKLLED